MESALSRRLFLHQSVAGLSAAWLSTHLPAVLAASEHAHQASGSATPPKFEFFTPEEAVEVDAISARIIPTDDSPGAREAGVLYFIDRALATFASDDQKTYRSGIGELQSHVAQMFPSVQKFSAASTDQQDEILQSLDESFPQGSRNRRAFGPSSASQGFFELLRVHTITAFLIDPESGGNRNAVGWKLINREPQHMFQPPFGFYDKDYPGWKPDPSLPIAKGEKK